VAIVASGWFLLVSPKRGDASALRAESASAESANTELRGKLEQLKALAPELPKRQAEFAAIRRQIPDNPSLPQLIRQLNTAAKKSNTDLISVSPATPVEVVTATEPTATGAAAPSTDKLMQVPLTLSLTGSYSELEDMINELEGLRRSMLVTSFTLTPDSAGTTGGGLKLDLSGRVYMVNAGAAVTQTPVTTDPTTTITTPGETASTPVAPAS
jgi:Tfp pilus assembly protein PilO